MCKLDAVQFGDIWTLYDQDGEYSFYIIQNMMYLMYYSMYFQILTFHSTEGHTNGIP